MAIGGGGGSSGAIRAGRAFVELFAEDSRLVRALERGKAHVASFARFVARAGVSMLTAGGSILAPLKFAVDSLNDLSRQGSIANAFGLTVEQFSGIAGVAKSAGEDTREFIESLVTLGKVASEGVQGTPVAAEFFKSLNLEAREFAALQPDEQFYRFFEAVQNVEDPMKRVRALMTAFGEDGGKYLLPLLDKSPEQLRQMGREFAISSGDVKQAQAAQAAYTDATQRVSTVWRQVVVAVAPIVEAFATAVSTVARPIAAIVSQNQDVIRTVLLVGAALATGGAALVAFSAVAATVAGGLGAIGTAITTIGTVASAIGAAIASPIGVALIAVGALAGGFLYLWSTTESGQSALSRLKSGFGELLGTAKTTFKGIANAISAGDLKLAGRIAIVGLSLEFAKAMGWWLDRWNEFKGFFVEGWHDAIKLIKLAWNELDEWFSNMFLGIVKGLNDAMGGGIKGIIDRLIAIINRIPPAVRNTLGLKDLRSELEIFSDAFGTGGFSTALDDAKRENKKEHERRRSEIENDAWQAALDRAASRTADADEVAKTIRDLEEGLAKLAMDAEAKAAAAGIKEDGLGAVGVRAVLAGLNNAGRAAAAVQFSANRGGFGGPLAAQFGYAAGDIAKRTLEASERTADGVAALPDRLAAKFAME